MNWQLVLAGLLVGTLVGLTGMGGGSLMTPILVLLFNFDPAVAIGTDIAHGAVFKSVGALQHRRMGNVQARLSGWMFLGSAPMSLVGVWLTAWLALATATASIPLSDVYSEGRCCLAVWACSRRTS